jgi:hypothetical protein
VRAGNQSSLEIADEGRTSCVHRKVPNEVGDKSGRHPWLRVLLIFDCVEKTFVVQNSRNIIGRAGIIESMIIVDRQIRGVPRVAVVKGDCPVC